MTTKEKLIDYLKVKGISKTKFYAETGLSNGFLDSGKSLSVDNLKRIISVYRDINLNWLLHDVGEKTEFTLMEDIIPYSSNNNVCEQCIEKQKKIDLLQDQIMKLIDDSLKDRELLRRFIASKDATINKQQDCA
ncbi:MAG: hypothetical protein JXA77_04020 [Bacteroidales bacterium]|nr:hypothetical protein [Bacteroidales bacterium]